MIGKSMYMSKKGASLDAKEIETLVGSKEKLSPCRGYESDYERVTRDEQTDDYAGFPQIITEDGFK